MGWFDGRQQAGVDDQPYAGQEDGSPYSREAVHEMAQREIDSLYLITTNTHQNREYEPGKQDHETPTHELALPVLGAVVAKGCRRILTGGGGHKRLA